MREVIKDTILPENVSQLVKSLSSGEVLERNSEGLDHILGRHHRGKKKPHLVIVPSGVT